MDFWDEIDELRRAWDVLEHPVYRRLMAGSLSWAELAGCVGQYGFVLDALADASGYAASQGPAGDRMVSVRRAGERERFVSRWGAFAARIGLRGARPTTATAECAVTWRGGPGRGPVATAVMLYAVESAQPAITFAALRAIEEHYGVRRDDVVRPLVVSTDHDRRSAQAIRARLQERLDAGEADRADLLSHAEAAYSAHWELLDGCPEALGDVLFQTATRAGRARPGTARPRRPVRTAQKAGGRR